NFMRAPLLQFSEAIASLAISSGNPADTVIALRLQDDAPASRRVRPSLTAVALLGGTGSHRTGAAPRAASPLSGSDGRGRQRTSDVVPTPSSTPAPAGASS